LLGAKSPPIISNPIFIPLVFGYQGRKASLKGHLPIQGFGHSFHKAAAKDAKNCENSYRLIFSFTQKMWKKCPKQTFLKQKNGFLARFSLITVKITFVLSPSQLYPCSKVFPHTSARGAKGGPRRWFDQYLQLVLLLYK
jgi:hypothetical protein